MSEFINTYEVIGEDELCDRFIMRTLTEYKDDRVAKVGANAFRLFSPLETVELPNATEIEDYAFQECTNLKNVRIPNVGTMRWSTFYKCTSITEIKMESVTFIGQNSFSGCTSLTTVILSGESICALESTNVFTDTPIASGTGYIYVPRALLSDTDATKDYRRATNWSTFAAQFRAIEDFSVDGTVTGELDETKI